MSPYRFGCSCSIISMSVLFAFPGSALAQRGDVEVLRFRNLTEARAALPQLDLRGLDALPAGVDADGSVAPSARERPGLGSRGDRPRVMLTGYWPPTNEMIRRFSPSPEQNPQGWVGSDWEGRGYDVYSYFPEFDPPDCGSCGKGEGDLEVDYQDTSYDVRAITDTLRPAAIITFSRGYIDLSWEVELNQYNRDGWIGDYQLPLYPDPSPPDRSIPADALRLSALPLEAIVNAVDEADLGLDPYVAYTGDGGGFLSEFIAYHGVWYHTYHALPQDADWCVLAGHVHVGGEIPWEVATQAAEVTLRTVLDRLDETWGAETCQVNRGYGGPGQSVLSACGDVLRSGGSSQLLLQHAPPDATAAVVVGPSIRPRAFRGGTLAPDPPQVMVRLATDQQGRLEFEIPGGSGPATRYVQVVFEDSTYAEGHGFSNTLELEWMP